MLNWSPEAKKVCRLESEERSAAWRDIKDLTEVKMIKEEKNDESQAKFPQGHF